MFADLLATGAPPSVIEALRSHEYFSVLSSSQLSELIAMMRVLPFRAGDELTRAGEPGRALFVLLKGNVAVVSERSETVIAEQGPGTCFGEIGFLYDVPRTMTVRVKDRAVVGILPRENVLPWMLREEQEGLLAQLGALGRLRYEGNRPPPLPCHRSVRKLFESLFPNESQFERLQVRSEPAGRILSFLDVHKIYVLEGRVRLCSPSLHHMYEFIAGELIEPPEELLDELVLPHLVSQTQVLFLTEKNESGSINAIESSHNKKIVMAHDRLMPKALNPVEQTSPLELLDNDLAALASLLLEHGLPADTSIFKSGSSLDLSYGGKPQYRSQVNDQLVAHIAALFSYELIDLNLSGCHRLTDASLSALADNCPSLKSISLNDCYHLSGPGLKQFSGGRALTNFSVAGLPLLSGSDLQEITDSLMELTALDISYCHGISSDSSLWKTLCGREARGLSPLRVLAMRRALFLSDTILYETPLLLLEELDLSACPFVTTQGLKHLLQQCPLLNQLSAQNCHLDVEIVKRMAHELCPSLKTIGLGNSIFTEKKNYRERRPGGPDGSLKEDNRHEGTLFS